jgi:hypothetical protein
MSIGLKLEGLKGGDLGGRIITVPFLARGVVLTIWRGGGTLIDLVLVRIVDGATNLGFEGELGSNL